VETDTVALSPLKAVTLAAGFIEETARPVTSFLPFT
jgi:hypothetical protein